MQTLHLFAEALFDKVQNTACVTQALVSELWQTLWRDFLFRSTPMALVTLSLVACGGGGGGGGVATQLTHPSAPALLTPHPLSLTQAHYPFQKVLGRLLLCRPQTPKDKALLSTLLVWTQPYLTSLTADHFLLGACQALTTLWMQTLTTFTK